METKEKNFEDDIEAYLFSHDYRKGTMATYDKYRAIDMPMFVEFIEARNRSISSCARNRPKEPVSCANTIRA